jgi:SAM-dependent methyltransferase
MKITDQSFAMSHLAEGYMFFRPPIHHRIIELARARITGLQPVRYALDLGCGAGLSTKALEPLAERTVGIEPVEAMLGQHSRLATKAHFVTGQAEKLPFRTASINLVTAAGSLNYTDLDVAVQELERVLAPHGTLLVYDFSTGKSFRGSMALDHWFDQFIERYPWPPQEAIALDRNRLSNIGSVLKLQDYHQFELGLNMDLEFYLNYLLTETNVAFAMKNGVSRSSIREWCAATLQPLWTQPDPEILFRGYFAYLLKQQ